MKSFRLIPSPVLSVVFWFVLCAGFTVVLLAYASAGWEVLFYPALTALLVLMHLARPFFLRRPEYGHGYRFTEWKGTWREPSVLGAGGVDFENGCIVSRDWRGRERNRWLVSDLTELEIRRRSTRSWTTWEFHFRFGDRSFVAERAYSALEPHRFLWLFRSPRGVLEKWFVLLPALRARLTGLTRGGIELSLPRPYAQLHLAPLRVSYRSGSLVVNDQVAAVADLLLEGRADAPDIRLGTPAGIGFLVNQESCTAGSLILVDILVKELHVREISTRQWWNRSVASFFRRGG